MIMDLISITTIKLGMGLITIIVMQLCLVALYPLKTLLFYTLCNNNVNVMPYFNCIIIW